MFLLTIIIAWIVAIRTIRPFGFIHIAFVYLTFHSISSYRYGVDRGETLPAYIILLSMLVISLTYSIRLKLIRHYDASNINRLKPSKSDYVIIKYFSVFIIFFVIYHHVVGGIPLFSPDILLARFDNTTSGLFGLPGRINLFGTFFLFFLLFAYSRLHNKSFIIKLLFAIATSTLIISLIFKGSKGTLIHLVVAILIASQLNRISKIKWMSGKFVNYSYQGLPLKWLFISFALGMMVFMTVTYLHIEAGTQYTSIFDALLRRTTEISGMAYHTATTTIYEENGPGLGKYLIQDVYRFFDRFGGPGGEYSTMEIVSANTTGTPLDGSHYIVPVELNIIGFFFLEAGIIGVLIGSIILGLVLANLRIKAGKTNNTLILASVFYIQMLLFYVIIKGDIAWYIFNMGIMLILFVTIIHAHSSVLRTTFNRRPSIRLPIKF